MEAPLSLPEAVDQAIQQWRADYSFVGVDPLPKGPHGAALSTRLVEAVQAALQSRRDIEMEELVEENNALQSKVQFLEARATPSNIPILEELDEAYLVIACLAQKLLANTAEDTVLVTEEDREAAARSEIKLDRPEENGPLSIVISEPTSLARSLEQST